MRSMSVARRAALPLIAGITLILAACSPEQQALYAYAVKEATPEEKVVIDRYVADWIHFDKIRRLGEALERNAAEAARRAADPLHPFLVCVRHHESDRGPYPHMNGYQAQNPRSSASGAYQFLNDTWRNVAPKAGYPGYSRAMYAPPHVQDAVALWLYNNGGRSAWNGSGC